MDFEIVGEITNIETFAAGVGVRDRKRLWKMHGRGRWLKRKGIAQVRLISGKIRFCGDSLVRGSRHRQTRIQAKASIFGLNMSKNGSEQFAICLNNEGYQVSLETGKLYRVVQDKEASKEGYIRVIDESGEDYAFAADRFYVIDLPTSVRKTLLPRLQPV